MIFTLRGKCRDCAQGILTKVHEGFEQYEQDGERLHWFCRYCGSNHVTIYDNKGGIVIEQGDNYPDAPTYYTDGEGFEVWSG